MTSSTVDTDSFKDDIFFFEAIDAFTLPLLDFGSDDTLLTPCETARSHMHLQQTPFPTTDSHLPTNSAEIPALRHQSLGSRRDTTLSPSLRMLGSFVSTYSPRPSGQKLLAPRMHKATSKSSSKSKVATSTLVNATKSVQSNDETQPMLVSTLLPDALTYAMPVTYCPPSSNASRKRPSPHVFPGATFHSVCGSASSSIATTTATAATDNKPIAKRSKREIRQIKNRESANKSHLRRKVHLTALTTEVSELKKKEQKMQAIIDGLRAENKSLLDQNKFLRSWMIGASRKQLSKGSSGGSVHAADTVAESELRDAEHAGE